MPLIADSQTARELAAKSHEARRRNNELRILAAQEPQPEPLIEPNPIQSEVARVRAQLEALNKQLDECDDADTWDCLTRSKERLFKIWARLAQIPTDPKPVQQRATNTRKELPPPTVAQTQPAPSTSTEAGQGQAGQG